MTPTRYDLRAWGRLIKTIFKNFLNIYTHLGTNLHYIPIVISKSAHFTVHEQGLMNLLWLATLVGGETIKYWENRTATEKTQFQKLPVHPSLAQAGGCEIFPFHAIIYSLAYTVPFLVAELVVSVIA
jgi:hypothetical protein